jgi:hypothetical protein
MRITPQASITAPPKKQRGHTAPKAPLISVDQAGRYRVAHLLAVLGISHATLYAGLKPTPGETTTRYPKPDGWDGKFPYWNTSTIRAYLMRDNKCNQLHCACTGGHHGSTARGHAAQGEDDER